MTTGPARTQQPVSELAGVVERGTGTHDFIPHRFALTGDRFAPEQVVDFLS
jgi:hypothetical protein